MVLPNLFVAGAQKSASSSLHEYLKQHPDIFMSVPKETNYFSYDKEYAKGAAYYSSLFADAEDYKIRGESSIGYMMFPNAIDRIKNDIPKPKFIFILRNPIDRVYSHYWFLRGRAYEDGQFLEAFMHEKDREPVHTEHTHGMFKFYYQFGLSYKWILKYIEAFGKESIYVMTSESLRVDPLKALNGCFEFLELKALDKLDKVVEENVTPVLGRPGLYPAMIGVATRIDQAVRHMPRPIKSVVNKIRNKIVWLLVQNFMRPQKSYPKLTSEQRAVVADYYRDDVCLLREITGESFYEWAADFPLTESKI